MFSKRNRLFPNATGQAPNSTAEAGSSRQVSGDLATDISVSRSRASSIVSTGTKTSVNTLPQAQTESHAGPIDVVLGSRNFRITARPGSILSISSFDHPAPPYSAAIGANASESTATLTGPSLSPSPPPPDLEETDHATPVPQRSRPSPLLTTLSEVDAGWDENPSREDSPPSPPLSPLSSSTNAISAHYTTVVRTIDTNHLREIARLQEEHADALAQTRNDIDAAYRGPFREARDRGDRLAAENESLKQKAEEKQTEYEALLARCEEAEAAAKALEVELQGTRENAETSISAVELNSARAVDVARNEVEDLWEGRWRDRMRLAAEDSQASWQKGHVKGLDDGRLQGAVERQQDVLEIIENVTKSLPSIERGGEIMKWKNEILAALHENPRDSAG